MPELFALPETVAGYGSRSELAGQRLEAGQWVFWQDRVDAVLEGRYHDVKPLHVELSPTYLCNFSCPWCSCRTARETWVGDDVFAHPKATPDSVMDEDRTRRVLEHLAQDRIGIQWVGGEPTIHPALYSLVGEAQRFGLKQCLYTNGAALNEKRIERLLDAELAFVRVSLNAVTAEVHQRHHDYMPKRNYAERVLQNTTDLVRLKAARETSTEIGISIVVDERNIDDVLPTCRFVATLCERYGHGAVDFVIIRPTYQFYDAQLELEDSTTSRLADLVAKGNDAVRMLESVGVRVVSPKDSFRPETEVPDPTFGESCLSAGLFGEVTPRGDTVVCSDRYGNPDYFIGNLVDSTIDEIWASDARANVFAFAHRTRCFKTKCPRNGRGYFFNKLFHRIECLRRDGQIDTVRQWVSDLQNELPTPDHSFYI